LLFTPRFLGASSKAISTVRGFEAGEMANQEPASGFIVGESVEGWSFNRLQVKSVTQNCMTLFYFVGNVLQSIRHCLKFSDNRIIIFCPFFYDCLLTVPLPEITLEHFDLKRGGFVVKSNQGTLFQVPNKGFRTTVGKCLG
jgi:hypothetical protein